MTHREPELANGGPRALILEHRPALLRYLVARRVPVDEAEDVLQDLFVKLEEQPLGAVANPRAYLYRMTENLLLDRRRSAGRRSGREQAWMASRYGALAEVDDSPSAEERLIAHDRLARVTEALAGLPYRTLFIFRRFRIDAVPQKQIAAELGISVSAVEKHLHRAYQVVTDTRRRLDADEPPPQRPWSEKGRS